MNPNLQEPSRVPWGAARALLESIREGSQHDWGGRKGVISLALPELVPELSATEESERNRYDALIQAFRPGVALNARALQEAWVECIAAALQDRPLHLRIPDFSRWDGESASLLKPLLGRLGASQFGVSLGECGAEADGKTQREFQSLQVCLDIFGAPRDDESLELEFTNSATLTCQQAFSAYGFTTALAAAKQQLEAGCDKPAEYHAIAALALYHRDQMGLADPDVGAGFDAHAQAWVDTEDDVLRRSSGFYYLALYHGRFRRDFERGLGYANRALEEAGESPYHKAWGLNARAYQLARLGRVEEASRDCRQALEVPQAEPEPKLCWHLTGNLAQLYSEVGDIERACDWGQKQADYETEIPSVLLPLSWNYVHGDRRDLAATAERFKGRLKLAQLRMNPAGIALSHYFVGDLTYRLGQAAEALGHFTRNRWIWTALNEDPDIVFTVALNQARAALRAGELEVAESVLRDLMEGPYAEGDQRLELEASLALISARRGEQESALGEADRILGEADSDPFALLRLAPRLAEIYKTCGSAEKGKAALEGVRHLANDPGMAPEDAFMALAAFPELSAEEANLVLQLTPAALDEAECWWSLDALVGLLQPHETELPGPPYEQLKAASRQRVKVATCP